MESYKQLGTISGYAFCSYKLAFPASVFFLCAYNWLGTGSIFTSSQYEKIFPMQSNVSLILTIEIIFTTCVPRDLCAPLFLHKLHAQDYFQTRNNWLSVSYEASHNAGFHAISGLMG